MPAVKATFQAMLTATQTIHKPLSEHLLEDWRNSWTPPPPRDPVTTLLPLENPWTQPFTLLSRASSQLTPACTNPPCSKSSLGMPSMPHTHPASEQMLATTLPAHTVDNSTQSTTSFSTVTIFGTSTPPSSNAIRTTFSPPSPVARC